MVVKMKCPRCNDEVPPGETECPSCGTDCAYVERVLSRKDAEEQEAKKKEKPDDAKKIDRAEKYPRVYITSENTANFSCPNCNKYRSLDVSKYKDIQKSVRLKYKCQCGHSYSVILERREGGRRKETDLFGTYNYILSGKGARKGRISVKDVSLTGVKFELSLADVKIKQHSLSSGSGSSVETKGSADFDFKVGDKILTEFRLDNKKRSQVKKEAIIKWVNGPRVGAEFTSKKPDSSLGFYMFD